MLEIYKDVPNMQGYKVSNLGNVKSFLRDKINGKILNKRTDKDGYLMVNTKYNSAMRIHRMVASAFIDNPQNKPIVNHIDGNKKNNKLDNLEWSTVSENTKHSYDIGTSFSTISKGIHVYHNSSLISVYNSTRQLSDYCGLNRNVIARALKTKEPIFDELYLKQVKGNQSEHKLFKKPFLSRKLNRYQTQPCTYDNIYYESILELSKHLNISSSLCRDYIQKNKKYNGLYIYKITRYEYLRLKFND